MSLFLALTGFLVSAAGPEDFSLTIPVSPETPEGRRLVALRAIEICGARYPQLGRYRFTGSERVAPDGSRSGSFDVRQELTCFTTRPAEPAEAPAPADWRASAQDESAVRAATMAYFGATDAGDAARIHAMLSAERRSGDSLAERAAALRAFRDQAGTPGTHRILALTWYVNPVGAPRPGIYVAADYERAYSGLLANCGYLVWFREADGRYVLVREESAVVARGTIGDGPDELARARALARCRGN